MTLQALKERSERIIATNRSGRVAEIEHEYIIQVIERCEKLTEALGQIITITDDCQGMSRYTASVFDQHCKKALSLYGSEVPLK